MTIVLISMITLYIIIMLFTYSNIFRIIVANLIIYTVFLVISYLGIVYFNNNIEIIIFGKVLKQNAFFILLGGWFLLNIITTLKILRSYKEYKRVNSK